MCVSGVRSRVVSCERVRVSCEWASRRSSVVRREAFWFALKFSCSNSIFVSNFEFEFFVSLFYSTSRISCRISNSYFRFVALFDFSNFDFRFEFRIRFLEFSKSCFEVEFRIRFFRFVAQFDFSNFNFRFEFRVQVPWIFVSNLSSKFSTPCSIRLLEFRCAIQLLEFRCSIRLLEVRLLDSSALTFEVVLIYSTSRTLMIIKFSKLSFSCRILHLSS